MPDRLAGLPVVVPGCQGAGHQPVEEFFGLMAGVSAQPGQDLQVGAAAGLRTGVRGQYQCGQVQGGRGGRWQRQGHRVHRPVGGSVACAAVGRLVQDGGIEQPHRRTCRPGSGGSSQPTWASSSHSSRRPSNPTTPRSASPTWPTRTVNASTSAACPGSRTIPTAIPSPSGQSTCDASQGHEVSRQGASMAEPRDRAARPAGGR